MKYSVLFIFSFLLVDSAEQQEIPKDCVSDEHIIYNKKIQKQFIDLWEASAAGRPLNQRREQGGWIVRKRNDDYGIVPFPPYWQAYPCSIELPVDFVKEVPDNLVGIVHTHPFFEGDDTSASNVCGGEATEPYASGANYSDMDILVKVANEKEDFCIKAYIIDGNNIISVTTWGRVDEYSVDLLFSI